MEHISFRSLLGNPYKIHTLSFPYSLIQEFVLAHAQILPHMDGHSFVRRIAARACVDVVLVQQAVACLVACRLVVLIDVSEPTYHLPSGVSAIANKTPTNPFIFTSTFSLNKMNNFFIPALIAYFVFFMSHVVSFIHPDI